MVHSSLKRLGLSAVAVAVSLSLSATPVLAAWSVDEHGTWSFLNESGEKVTGWILDNGKWYYLNEQGQMSTGWVQEGNSWYYLNETGDMATGWVADGDNWYYMNETGDMATGWVDDGDTWYYLNESGDMATGWVADGDNWYYMNETGDMATGWVEDGESWYYLNDSGDMATGWVDDGQNTYFMSNDGSMQSGVIEVNGDIFYFDESGAQQTGEVTIDGATYNFDGENGSVSSDEKPVADTSFEVSEGSVTTSGSTDSSADSSANSSAGSSSAGSSSSDNGSNDSDVDYHTHSYVAKTTDATCQSTGRIIYTCVHCDDSYSETIAKLSHNYKAATTDATCESAGTIIYTCEACGDSYSETIAQLTHSYKAVTTDATCESAGTIVYTCDYCGDSYSETIAQLSHRYTDKTTPATCTEDGTIVSTCAACGDVQTKTIEAKGHDYDVTITAPTCESAGKTTYTCECGDSYYEVDKKPLYHDLDENGKCNGCGQEYLTATNSDAVKNIISSATDSVNIMLSEGEYNMPTNSTLQNKEITFAGTGDTIIDLRNLAIGANGASITFDGVTVAFGTQNYRGLQHTEKVVYKNCTLTGLQFMYAPDVEFINCTFENKNDYCVWTYGAENVLFENCIFKTGGKAILVYNEEKTSNFTADITLVNCVFNDDNTLNTSKGAVETATVVENRNGDGSNEYNIEFENCEVNGFAVNDEGEPALNTSTFWGNKNNLDTAHLNVVIDGEDVY